MNARTQITLGTALHRRAHARASELGLSFAEYVRRVLSRDLGGTKPATDVSVLFDLVDEGPATDIARYKDKMIADAAQKDHERSMGRKLHSRNSRRKSTSN